MKIMDWHLFVFMYYVSTNNLCKYSALIQILRFAEVFEKYLTEFWTLQYKKDNHHSIILINVDFKY